MRINNFIKTLICFSFVLCLHLVFAKESKPAENNIKKISRKSLLESSLEQKLSTEFSQDAIVAITICREADDLLTGAIVHLFDSAKEEERSKILYECLSDVYKAQEKFIDSRRIVEKWDKKGTIEQIVDEIGELKHGIEDLCDVCEMFSDLIEGLIRYSSPTTNEDTLIIKFNKATQKLLAARDKLFGFSAGWALRIHHGENKPQSHHVELTKSQYLSIKHFIDNLFKKEADEFKNSENRSSYTWCYRMFNWAVTVELEKNIEHEAIDLTRYIEESISTEVTKIGGENWVISKFDNNISVKTRFLEESESYDIQYVIAKGTKNRIEKSENTEEINFDEGQKAFIFSYDQYGEFCCLISFNKKDGKHECFFLISKK